MIQVLQASGVAVGAGGLLVAVGPGQQLIQPPADSEWIVRRGGHYYLPVSEIHQQASDTLAPVTEGEGPPAAAQAASRPANPDEFDEAYERAEKNNETLPFGRFLRVHEQAHNFRHIRATGPCKWSQVLRRKSVDPSTGEVLADDIKADKPWNFVWTARIPGGPKDLLTTFYYYLEGEEGALAQSVPTLKTRRWRSLRRLHKQRE